MSASGTVSAHPSRALISSYRPPPSVYDELIDAQGCLRPAWAKFMSGLEDLGPDRLTHRQQQSQRLFRENGLTYNVYGASAEMERPWELDLFPLQFSLAEWKPLAAGIEQRARLMNALMADLYGHQRLLQTGVLPASILFQSPGWLLPCAGIQPPGGVYLHSYGVQLARGVDGNWVVLSDRTQGASGAGYLVENRIIASRTFPKEFQDLRIVRLASFYKRLQETLRALCQRHGDDPRAVLLSPGPVSPRYFEDVYLARYLGYALAEGDDLTIRRDGVFLKTLGGLEPVDIILRRVRDVDCDSLDLRSDTGAGVAGLVQATRLGQVTIANALGCSVLETPVLGAFLPGLCRFLLNEDLILPSIPTWWCGDPRDLAFVQANFEQLVIRPAFRQRPNQAKLPAADGVRHSWTVATLSVAERQTLFSAVAARPQEFIAQEPIVASTAPIWDGQTLQPWHVTLRTFAVASGRGYQVLPGGLCRAAPNLEILAESITAGQRSKDVWVQSDAPVDQTSLLQAVGADLELRRSPNDLPSRAADHLFWLGRWMERMEALVRHLRSIVVRLTSELQPSGAAEMAVLVKALAPSEAQRFDLTAQDEDGLWELIRRETWSFLTDLKREGSLVQSLRAAQSAAAIVRDRLSVDGWRIISQLEFRVASADDEDLAQTLVPLNQLLQGISAFHGLCSDSMTRGPSWRFLDMGRRIERAEQLLRLMRGILVDAQSDILPRLEAMLEIADSSMTYRYRYRTTLQLPAVLDLLLADEGNPRAVAFQMATLADHLKQLATIRTRVSLDEEQAIVLEAQADIRLTDMDGLCEISDQDDRPQLRVFQARMDARLQDLSEGLMHVYLTHTAKPQRLSPEPLPPEDQPL